MKPENHYIFYQIADIIPDQHILILAISLALLLGDYKKIFLSSFILLKDFALINISRIIKNCLEWYYFIVINRKKS